VIFPGHGALSMPVPRQPNAACSSCGKPVYRSHSSRPEITCHECRRNNQSAVSAICKGCGRGFRPRPNGHSSTGWTRHCSLICANKTKKPTRRSLLTPAQRRAREKTRALARSRKRRLLLGAAAWDGVTDQEIFERDKWMCRIDKCLFGSRRINPKRKYPDPRSASVDHILPVVHGGDDTQFNKRASHLRCNLARQAGRPGEQLPLGLSVLSPGERRRRKPARKPQRTRPCLTCGEPVTGKCRLHDPVRYANCNRCNAPMIKRGPARICQACKTKPCVVPGCGRPVFFAATDWCAPHHHRRTRYGDVMADIPIADDRATRVRVNQIVAGQSVAA
jgi:hypothetical protein